MSSMYKHLLIGIILFLLCGWFWFVIKAQNYDTLQGDILLNSTTTSNGDTVVHYNNTLDDLSLSEYDEYTAPVSSPDVSSLDTETSSLDTDTSSTIEYIYRVNNVMKNLPFVVKKLNHLLTDSSNHAAPGAQILYELDTAMISDFLRDSQNFSDFVHNVRMDILEFIMANGYKDFITQPYPTDGDFAIYAQSWDYYVSSPIQKDDALDKLLHDKLNDFQNEFSNIQAYAKFLEFKPIYITTADYALLKDLYLFKDEQDLRDLWYELVSRKTRINSDKDYRRHNISTAFSNMGNVRLILSDEVFSLTTAFHYSSASGKKPYVAWYATIWGTPKKIYGGGLCGVATALFQWSMTNRWLVPVEYKAHSIYYRNLYEAEINGTTIKEPGLDATIYASDIDFKLQNIREYPIVTVYNYNGQVWTEEQVFTLSKAQDRWSFAYVGDYKKGSSKCFTWNINGLDMTNCYTKVLDY